MLELLQFSDLVAYPFFILPRSPTVCIDFHDISI